MSLEDIYALHQKIVSAENEVIAVVKADSGQRWVQHEFGWWYRYTNQDYEYNDYAILLGRDTCRLIHETVYALGSTGREGREGGFLLDAIREFDPSSGGPFCYQIMLREMSPGDTVQMLIPWNLAYGASGNMFIPPYTNIRARLTIHTSPYADIELAEDTIANQ